MVVGRNTPWLNPIVAGLASVEVDDDGGVIAFWMSLEKATIAETQRLQHQRQLLSEDPDPHRRRSQCERFTTRMAVHVER